MAVPEAQKQEVGITLHAFAGGFADAASFLLFRTFTGHVTGNLVLLMISLAHDEWGTAVVRLWAIACFVSATRLGFSLEKRSRSAVLLSVYQAALLLPLVAFRSFTTLTTLVGVAAFCCSLGLQNGVITSVLGVSVHSTFVSGDLTRLLKPGTVPNEYTLKKSSLAVTSPQSTRVLLLVVVGFAGGALTAAVVSRISTRIEPLLLLLPVIGAMLTRPPSRVDKD